MAGSEIVNKYKVNSVGGYLMASGSGDYPLFKGYPSVLKNRLTVVLTFDDDSAERFGVITSRIKNNTEFTGARYIVAGKDYQLHATVAEIERGEQVDNKLIEQWRNLIGGRGVINSLPGMKFRFDYPFVDKGGNVVVAATNIPDVILEVRKFVEKLAKENGLVPRPLDNIFHISTARPVRAPRVDRRRDAYRMPGVRYMVRNGIDMVVKGVIVDNSYDFLTGKK